MIGIGEMKAMEIMVRTGEETKIGEDETLTTAATMEEGI
jgi:hypothetical protein